MSARASATHALLALALAVPSPWPPLRPFPRTPPGPPGPPPSAPIGASARWRDFPAFVWRLDHAGRALPAALARGFTGTNVEGAESAEWTREQGLEAYLGSAAGWSELHLERDFGWYDALWKRWYEERDPALLVREPCLTEPATRAALRENLARSLAAQQDLALRFVLIGDEVGLTPWGDPLDLCTCAACQAAWSAYVGAHPAVLGPGLGLAPDAPLPPLPDTDRVRRALAEGDESLLGLWLARRRFHQESVLELLAWLAHEARALRPGSAPGLTGLVGQTAFGGVAFERLLGDYDVLEAYGTGYARELLFTLRDEQAALATIFVGERAGPSAAAAAHDVWEHWLRGGDGVVVWSDRELARAPNAARRLRSTLAAVRSLRAQLQDFDPRPAGLALVHDADSVALAWLFDALGDGATWPRRFAGHQEEHGTRERAVRAWLRLAEDVGLSPGALPLERLTGADGAVEHARRFPVLVLCHLRVLGDDDVAHLRAYLAAGGSVWVEGDLGTHDRSGARRAGELRAELAALWPERVLRPPAGLETYLTDRAAAPRRAAGLQQRARETLGARGVALAGWTARGASGPWLVAAADTSQGRVVALLPALTDGRELAGEPFELSLEGARVVRWLWPPGPDGPTRTLQPGEAAVALIDAD